MATSVRPKSLVSRTVSFSLFFADVLSVSIAFFVSLSLSNFFQGYFYLENNLSEEIYDYLSLIIYPAILILFYIKGHYTQRTPWWTQVRYIFGVCLIAFLSDIFIRLVLGLPLSEFFIVVSPVFSFFFILLGRQSVYFLLSRMGLWHIDTILIGSADTIIDILYAFRADYYTGYNVKTVLLSDSVDGEFDIQSVPSKYSTIEILQSQKNLQDILDKYSNHFFVISLETFQGEGRDKFIKELAERHILYSVAPPISSLRLFEMRPHHFFGSDLMLLHAKNTTPSFFKYFVKRSMDIGGALSALIILSPVIVAVMAFLKIEGQGGSLFYGGTRIGRNGKVFKCWKFRSMEPESDHLLHELLESDPELKADWEKYRKLKVIDPRVTTKTARIIRKTSLDELPQFWNVLIGNMSLVGPRPILPDEKEMLGEFYTSYIKVNPGITGLWQVSGRNDTSFERRIYMDSWYVRNWSIWGDVVILVKTVFVVLRGSGF